MPVKVYHVYIKFITKNINTLDTFKQLNYLH